VEPTALNGSEATQSLAGAEKDSGSRSATIDALDVLLSITDGLLASSSLRDLRDARARVAEDRFNLTVLGEFKRGKSTLINALLDRELLPTGVLPLTSAVTLIAPGLRDRLVVHYTDGRALEHPLTELAEYVTEARNPNNRLGVELARVELDHDLLRAGLQLIDTPGIGSIHHHNTEVARAFLSRVDAALCVLDAGQPLSDAERHLLADAARRIPRLVMVVNKIDHLDHSDRAVAATFVQSALAALLGPDDVELYTVSARSSEGLAPLRDRLLALASAEREALLLRSVAGIGHSIALAGAQAARFEAQAIQLPLEVLATRAREFDRRITELRAANAEAGDLLERGTERALRSLVAEPLQAYAHTREAELRTAIRDRAAKLGRCSPRELAHELYAWSDDLLRSMFAELVPRFEAGIADELTQLETRYAARVRQIIEAVQAAAEDVFGARAGDALPETGLRTPSRFSFKLHDVENTLDIIVGFGRTVTPGRFGRRLVVRDAEQRLVDMTDRHAGRLRSELTERVTRAVRDYRRDLAATVNEAIDAIAGAVDRATEDRRLGQRRSDARLRELARVERECGQIAQLMGRWLAEAGPADGSDRA
jgi:GTPase SAR1 family protein